MPLRFLRWMMLGPLLAAALPTAADAGALGPVADEGFLRISQKPHSSYEVIVDATAT